MFENTTPPAAFCVRWPDYCRGREVVDLPMTYVKDVTEASPRDQYYLRFPGRRQVDVFRDQTGESHTLTFEFTGVSQRTFGPPYYESPLYNSVLSGGCTRLRGFANPPWVGFLWAFNTPQAPTGCYSKNNRGIPDYYYAVTAVDMGVTYNLINPSPHRMKPGVYRGSVTYSIGPGGDFDFGDGVRELNGNTLTLHFELDVQHAFYFDFPPGSDRAVLEPRDGWPAWLAGGSSPQRLYRDLPFRLSSTGPFKVYKMCQYDVDSRCGIRNEEGDQVPVQVALTLPGGLMHGGQRVERLPLPSGSAQALEFESSVPTFSRPGQLHFEVGRADVPGMLGYSGSTYSGQVTVVFDAEL
ncbi:hypothetical protein [Pseudomonas reidholzensis]|uniref:hypothetical protein n=1 Tax=Pseudomonas reidholzensis TaxID=1785162 RepID=UPI001FC8F6C0|nr:hypothetical protein [Pseudomonas reidholzensis]